MHFLVSCPGGLFPRGRCCPGGRGRIAGHGRQHSTRDGKIQDGIQLHPLMTQAILSSPNTSGIHAPNGRGVPLSNLSDGKGSCKKTVTPAPTDEAPRTSPGMSQSELRKPAAPHPPETEQKALSKPPEAYVEQVAACSARPLMLRWAKRQASLSPMRS